MKISKKVKRSFAVAAICLVAAVAALIAAQLMERRFPTLDADFILYAAAAIACFFAFRRMWSARSQGTEEGGAYPHTGGAQPEETFPSARAAEDLRAAIRRRKAEARQSHETK